MGKGFTRRISADPVGENTRELRLISQLAKRILAILLLAVAQIVFATSSYALPAATTVIPSTALTQNKATTAFTPVTSSGGTAPLSYSVAPPLPSGLTFNTANGSISGTPTVSRATTTFTVTVTDANNDTASSGFTLTVNGAVTATQAIPSLTLTAGISITSFSPVIGGGGTGPLTYSISPAIPAGLSMSSAAGTLSGTATVSSVATTYTVTVTDANGASASNNFMLRVNPSVTATQSVPAATLTSNHAITPFTPVSGAGGTTPLTYSVSPSLPAGLTLNSSMGTISGTPTASSAATTYTVTVMDVVGSTASNTFALTVNGPVTATQAIAAATLTSGHAAVPFSPVSGSGGTGTLTYTVTPSLPAGLSLNSSTGTVSGTPSTSSVATTYTVTLTDANSATASNTFILQVNTSVTATQAVATVTLTSNHTTSPFTPVTGAGGTTPLTFSVAPSLPAGLSMNSSTGTISGTPLFSSVATTYTVTVTDSNSATASNTFILQVSTPVTATQAVATVTLTSNHAASPFTPVTGAGGTTPLTYSVSPSLPAGLSMNSSTGAISGTPSASSVATTYTVTVTDTNNAAASNTFVLSVHGPVTATQSVATATLTSGHAASSFAPVAGSGGTTPIVYSISPALPAGLSMNSSTGAISGTPTVTLASTTFTVAVTDANSATASNSFSLAVNGAVTASQSVPSGSLTAGHAATSFTPVSGSGGTSPLAYSISPTLPAGLSISSPTGVISGTPTAALAATTFTVTVTDANSATASNTFSLAVNGAVTATQSVASVSLTSGHPTAAFIPVSGSGGRSPLSYSISPALPAGLTINASTGTVSGTPTAALAATSFTVTVKDGNGATAASSFALTVNVAVSATQAVASATLTSGHAAAAFTPVTGNGGTGGLSYSVAPSLPAGLSLSSSNGTVSGTPVATANGSYVITVTDANGATASASFNLTVNGAITATQAVASATFTSGHPAALFTPVIGSGGTGSLSYSVSPSLPAGLSLSTSNGAVSGTPNAAVTGSYIVTVTDVNGATASAAFNLTVNGAVTASQSVASTTLTGGHAATPFTPVTGSGGTGSLTYGVSPSLPAGLAFNTATGAVSGTPSTASGAASYTVTVTDTNGATANATFALTVNGAVAATQAIASQTLILGHALPAFTPVTGSGGTGALSYTLSPTLPAGLTFNTATGAISGTATATSGAITYTVSVTDINGASASAAFSLTVALPTLTFTPSSLVNGVAGNAYAQVLSAAGGMAPYTYTVSGGTLPDGLSLDASSGKLSGTPKAAGSSNFTIKATDANSATGSITYALTVSGPAITVASSTAAVVAGVSTTVDLTQGATGGPFTGARLLSLSPASAGSAIITLGDTAATSPAVVADIVGAGHYKLKFTASPAFSGTAVATFTLSNVFGASPPATITFTVTPRKDPSKDPDVIGLINAQTDAAKRFAETQISNFNDHLEQLHGDGCLENQWGLSVSDNRSGSKDSTRTPQTGSPEDGLLPRKDKDKLDHRSKTMNDGKDRCSPFGEGSIAVWTGGFVNFGSRSTGSLDQGYDFTTVGVSAGIDYRFNRSFTAGVGLGYGSDQSRIGDNGTQSDAKAYSFALYGSYHPTPDTFIDGLAGYGQLNFDSKRFAIDTQSYAIGSRDGHQFFGSVTTGYEYAADGLLISPYGRLSASRSTLDPFTESGADWANLSYGSQSVDTLTGTLGVRIAYNIGTDWGSITPRGRLEYGHDFAGDSSVSLGYADLPNSKFDLKTLGTGNDYATISLGADFRVGQNLSIGAEYGTTLGQTGSQPQQVRLSIRERF